MGYYSAVGWIAASSLLSHPVRRKRWHSHNWKRGNVAHQQRHSRATSLSKVCHDLFARLSGCSCLVDCSATLVAWPQLHSFSIGLPNSPDLLAARNAAAFLGTVHHEYTFTVQEGLDALEDVV